MGPPSSGGVHIIQMLNILKNYDLAAIGHNSSDYINLLTEVMKHAYADRSKYLGDPDFYDVPINKLTSKLYAESIVNKIELGASSNSSNILPGMYMDYESDETTHFSVADKYGNVVSSTYTLNSAFGSGVVIQDTGILMNNEMDDFSAAPGIPNQFGLLGAKANEIVPFKRPLSSMTPTIVMKNNELFFTTGSPGGSRIISAVLQSILNIIDFEMNLQEAGDAPRIRHSSDDQPTGGKMLDGGTIYLESGFDYESIRELLKIGHKVGFDLGSFGGYQAIKTVSYTHLTLPTKA